MEEYKDIPGYENHYQISDLGNIRSSKNQLLKNLKPVVNKYNYLQISLSKNGNIKVYRIHQLVAITFLNFKPDGHTWVVNHINFNKQDNRLINLEIVSNRDNCNKLHIKSSSQYTGVSFRKDRNKWAAEIMINNKRMKLGHYLTEVEAHNVYQIELNKLKIQI